MKVYVTKDKVPGILKGTNGTMFYVVFRKRTDGRWRRMSCRTGVTKALHGGEKAYEPSEKNLFLVYDIKKEGYRSINMDDVSIIKTGGVVYKVEGGIDLPLGG